MDTLIKDLSKLLALRGLSPERAAGYLGCSGVQIRRWIKGEAKPSPLYKKAIAAGIKKIDKEK
jgi:transcriptional regulator with XRE-family HTH domain